MIDRLEKFQAPKHPSDLIYGLILLGLVLLAVFIPAPSADKIPSKTEAAEKVRAQSSTLPFAYPLGCPEEDAKGRKLKGTISIQGERKIRCYYGS